MKFFLGLECYGKAFSICNPICNYIGGLLEEIRDNDYGEELTEIDIISVIMPEEDYPYYPERRFISRKEKWADIRLHIDYKSFVNTWGKMPRRFMWITFLNASVSQENVPKGISKRKSFLKM